MDWLLPTLLGGGLMLGFIWLAERLTSRLVNLILYGDSRGPNKINEAEEEPPPTAMDHHENSR